MATQHTFDPRILALCDQVTSKRARVVIDLILANGSVTTAEIEAAGYKHAPRATRDVKEQGIPLNMRMVAGPDNKRMAEYTFGGPEDIQAGRIGGRKAFPKKLKQELLNRDGSVDRFTGQEMPTTALTIDHRIPYEVIGDTGDDLNPADFMLLDASSQRSKSWSCEHCSNWKVDKDPNVCRACYWAFPENFHHMALLQLRRADVSWSADEVESYDTLAKHAKDLGVPIQHVVKEAVEDYVKKLSAD